MSGARPSRAAGLGWDAEGISEKLTMQFIRTVTEVRPEWLLEYAQTYFDPESFPKESETRRALQRVIAKVRAISRCAPAGNRGGPRRMS